MSQSLAQTLFPGENPLNRELRWTDGVMKFIGISTEPRRIVGVVPDLDDENIIPSPAMTVYQPTDQEGWEGRLFVRTDGDPYALTPAITRTNHDISAEQPVEHASTLQDIRAEVLTPDKLNAVVFGGFAAVALLISVVGVAGVLAFSVSGRTREFGIRMALGAQPKDIMTDVLKQGLTIACIGVIAGALFGIVFARGIGALRGGCASARTFADFYRVGLHHSGRSGDRVGRARSTCRKGERGGSTAFGIARRIRISNIFFPSNQPCIH